MNAVGLLLRLLLCRNHFSVSQLKCADSRSFNMSFSYLVLRFAFTLGVNICGIWHDFLGKSLKRQRVFPTIANGRHFNCGNGKTEKSLRWRRKESDLKQFKQCHWKDNQNWLFLCRKDISGMFTAFPKKSVKMLNVIVTPSKIQYSRCFNLTQKSQRCWISNGVQLPILAFSIGSSLKRVRIIASARQNAVQKEQIPEFIAIDGVLRIWESVSKCIVFIASSHLL